MILIIIIFPTFCVLCGKIGQRCLPAAGRYTCTTHGYGVYIFPLFFDIPFISFTPLAGSWGPRK
jgi:hypothetical protein